uniref:Uncharacterized protein n=1 Tax=Periophthalmus magnuspinnatus TaxID=409849 RepID=A0A3B3ZIF4_9GOBI
MGGFNRKYTGHLLTRPSKFSLDLSPQRTETQSASSFQLTLRRQKNKRSNITPSLFLSGSDGAQNGPLVSRKGITLIVNATLAHPSPPLPGVEVLRVPVSDLPSAPLHQHFDRVAERIHSNSGKTLVHCAAGMSRSPALVMAYLMRFRGVSLQQAHALVRERRPHIRLNRGFWQQLLTYERRLYGSNSVRLAEDTDEDDQKSMLSLSVNQTDSGLCVDVT